MNATLEIALIQSHLSWENPIQNRSNFEQKINLMDQKVDLIVLPEMFNTGFTMNAVEVAETMDGETINWLKKLAKEKNCAICGSIIIKDIDRYYNRFLFVTPDGTVQKYDKHQLFTLAKEEEVFTAGMEDVIISYKGWKIKPQVCYDLRFPVWARNTSGYDVLLYVASWPKPRVNAWDALLKARAIENMSYCIGVNRVGLDGKGYEYNGHSAVYDVLGNSVLEENPIEKETTLYARLEKSHIQNTRNKLPFLNDADDFQITLK
ncbi:amidohydrolase [Aquimarina sp. 2201CG14-23]|uniref:amidohydrolase n=1 Tax=Aquimarina mycalae TaxID=3040073 RepID=UPI002477D77F|nr:amidohydrolase [Aquimarina sp. 2201CG14-23]MDH7446154.1 amidohydrolase [Aquimarina sp. 2201CG14-23]